PGVHPSEAGVASAAAALVLRTLYVAEAATVDDQHAADAAELSLLPSERDADCGAGAAVGESVAARVLAHAATDGSTAPWTGTLPVGPGYWVSAPGVPPLGPSWGAIRPWLMTSGRQFRPAPPPAFGSPEYRAALAEVRAYTDARTPEQLQVAIFWQAGSGPGGPMGFFGERALQLAAARHLDERATTRVLALMFLAQMDALIGCWDAKYHYAYLRPHQGDPGITTPVGRPNFPAYPSGHSCLSSSAARVLAGHFPDARGELAALVEEAGLARLYGGLHFRFDVDAGRTLGENVAALALARARDHGPLLP
ncbi:vanadium-dependent haloperoxidase, partial [Roseisolibacter sp. H3M3-2]|uniref:vanadium-dependent haloperoxidase n=1 Tax=Roseisolibacter sp. H3M3-2 TaxID=3031323 RepID=UPI0023DCEA1E